MTPDLWHKGQWDRRRLALWRSHLKRALLKKRGGTCNKCGIELTEYTGGHLHEALVTRAEIPFFVPWHYRIHSEANCLILCVKCHMISAPSKKWAWDYLSNQYGEEAIKEWLEGLPWKNGKPPQKFW